PYITIDPRDGRSIYARTTVGLYRSRDRGETWELFGPQAQIVNALLFPSGSTPLYAATTAQGVLVSDSDGATWQPLGGGLPAAAILSLARPDSRTLVAGTQAGVYVTRDAGETWQPASEGMGAPAVHDLALDPPSGALFAATDDGLFKAPAAGSFVEIGGEVMRAPVLSIALAPGNPQLVYAGTSGRGIFSSRDGGASWSAAGGLFQNKLSVPGLAVNPEDDRQVLARVVFERIYKSADGGDEWHAVWTGMPNEVQVACMTFLQSKPRVIFAGTSEGIFVSEDAGESWTRRGLSEQSVFAILPDRGSDSMLLAGATEGVYGSRDGGAAWRRLGLANITVTSLLRAAGGELYAGTKYNGIWVSRDEGQTWTTFGLERQTVVSLVVDEARHLLYAATTNGVFRAALPGGLP
ncbi:MAG: WD40/YVTN/BNR-like repeat-containing protein, partial [Rudaea sp.]